MSFTAFAFSTEEVRGLIGAGARPAEVRELARRFESLDAYLEADEHARAGIPRYEPRPLGLGAWEWALGPADAAWPAGLAAAAAPPVLLYGCGDPSALDQAGLAVIGSRKMTRLGERTAGLSAESLVRHGGTVISGGALGCDSQAHRSCLEVGGVTVAVLAGEITEHAREPERRALLGEIATNGGVVVSEQRPGSPANAQALMARNRLITALSCGIVVCEAGFGSGTCQAIRCALEQHRPILVPRPRGAAQGWPGAAVLNALADERGMDPEALGLRGEARRLVQGLYPVANGVAEDPETLDALIELSVRLGRGGMSGPRQPGPMAVHSPV